MFVNATLYTLLPAPHSPKLLRPRTVKYDKLIGHILNQLFMFRQYYVFWSAVLAHTRYAYRRWRNPTIRKYLRIKLKFRKFRKFKLLRPKFKYNPFLGAYRTTLMQANAKLKRIPKINIRKFYPMVLKSRRLLKVIWAKFVWKAKKLTTQLLKFFKKNITTQRPRQVTLLTALVTFGIAMNSFDASYWIENRFVQINKKITTNRFYCLNPGDIVHFGLCVFAAKYTAYFSKFYVRWLRRKKKKNIRRVVKFINRNRLPLQIKKHFRRWLLLSRLDKLRVVNLDADYRTNMICCFYRRAVKVNYSCTNVVYRSLGILNLWYYNY